MRPHVLDMVKLVADTLPCEGPIWEIGSYQTGDPIQEDLRPFFPGKEYVGIDMREGPGVDVVCDFTSGLHNFYEAFEGRDRHHSTSICVETLEHVSNPFLLVENLEYWSHCQSMAFFVTPFAFPIHEHPHDYFRYTPDGLKAICEPFDSVIAGFMGDPYAPHTTWALCFNGEQPGIRDFYIGCSKLGMVPV